MRFGLVESMLIDEELKKKGISRGLGVMSPDYSYFAIEQLSLIEELTLQGFEDITFLKFLPNLKKLCIISENPSNVMDSGTYFHNPVFNQIKDFRSIELLSQLEELQIINDVNITSLDCSKLENLKKLIIVNNPRLSNLSGMGNLHYLRKILMYGNPIRVFDSFKEYLYNTLDAETNIIDIDTYYSNVRTLKDAKALYDASLIGQIRVLFAEKSGFLEYTTVSVANITELYEKLKRRLQKDKVFDMPDEEKIAYVYAYGLKVKFARKELEERKELYSEILSKYNGVPDFYKRRMNFLHNSYNTFHFNFGNCEGIVNLMRFMLYMLNIESENIHCHDKRYSSSIEHNHALLRIKTNGVWLYYDAVYDRENPNHIYAKTYFEISEYVDLSKFEKETTEVKQRAGHYDEYYRRHR